MAGLPYPYNSRWSPGVVAIDVLPKPAANHHSSSSSPPKSQLFPTSTTTNKSSRKLNHYHSNHQSQGSLAHIPAALDRSPSQPLENLNSCPESICGEIPVHTQSKVADGWLLKRTMNPSRQKPLDGGSKQHVHPRDYDTDQSLFAIHK
jgi:hypothetical protein